MKAPLLDSLSLKIHSFLRTAGVTSSHTAPSAPGTSTPEEVRVLEQENDLSIMRFLEHEWLEEQITRDLETGAFSALKKRNRFE